MSNSLKNPTFERLDRVLVSTEWEQHYPLATIVASSREISDHTPPLLSTGEEGKGSMQHMFKFELSWLLKENFFDLVSEVWNKENRGNNALQKWQNKIRRLRQFLRGWAINLNGAYRKEKEELLWKTNELDKKSRRLSFELARDGPQTVHKRKTCSDFEGGRN